VDVQNRKEILAGRRRSLTVQTFEEALIFYRENTTANLERVDTLIDRLIRDLGAVRISDLTERFGEYWNLLKTERSKKTGDILTNATRNRLLVYGKTALALCMKRGLLEKNPLTAFQKLPEEGRDRILTPDEEARLLETLERNGSYLLMPVKFSLKNPIRKGDLVSLTRENLDRFRPWVHFYASKTRTRKNRETCLPFLDNSILEHFDNLPAECPYLFPRGIECGKWKSIGDFKKHWHDMLEKSRITDLHFHDLKHCAVTWMLDNGYTERDLKNLGIQYSPAMINRYYHTDAGKVLAKWKNSRNIPGNHQQKTAT